MKLFIFIFFIFLNVGCSSTGLWVANSLADFSGYQVFSDRRYGQNEKNVLDIYLPESVDGPMSENKLPVIVFFYGGCWGACETFPKENYAFAAQALTTKNNIVVIPDYRLYPAVKFPQIIHDAAQVVEWVKANIENYGGDPDRIVLMGHSAGAHLASLLTLDEDYLLPNTRKSLRGFIGMAGPYDFLPFNEDYQPILFGPASKYMDSQPVNFVDGTEPPLLLLYGEADTTVKPRNIENLTKLVKSAGGCVEAHYYKSLDHTGIIGTLAIPLQNSSTVLQDVNNFLTKHLNESSFC